MFQARCKERDGEHLRAVRPIEPDPAWILDTWEKLQRVPNFTEGDDNPLGSFVDQNNLLFQVDDVGVILVSGLEYGKTAHVHVTFWDRRLRGRENLCKCLAELVIEIAGLKNLYTVIPESSQVVKAFAQRVGFEERAQTDGNIVMVLTKGAI